MNNPNSQLILDKSRTFTTNLELKSFYDQYGYVSIKDLFPKNLINDVASDLTICFQDALGNNSPIDENIISLNNTNKNELWNLHTGSSKIASIRCLIPIISETIKKISGENTPIFEIASTYLLGIPKDQRLIYNHHQESNYMKGFDEVFNVHYPIFRESNPYNGTMSALVGSHKLGTLTFDKKKSAKDSYTDLIPTNIEEIASKYEEVHFLLNPGDCVIFHKDLIHRSNFNSSDLCRPVGVSRFTQSINGDWMNRSSDDL
jgi:ectoine hydroxylase-related dioxygenase (phytanoyl-CoA dioxygenase family)